DQGDHVAARALFEESLAIYRELGRKDGMARSLGFLGLVANSEGEYGAARASLKESLALFREQGSKGGVVKNLVCLAAVALSEAQFERAARLLGSAEGLREAMGTPLALADRAEHDRTVAATVAAAREALGEEAFAAAWAEGQAMPLEEAIEYA